MDTSQLRGVHGSVRTHSVPQAEQANSRRPSYDDPVGPQSQRFRQGAISRGTPHYQYAVKALTALLPARLVMLAPVAQ
jgi:hypothetical protein